MEKMEKLSQSYPCSPSLCGALYMTECKHHIRKLVVLKWCLRLYNFGLSECNWVNIPIGLTPYQLLAASKTTA